MTLMTHFQRVCIVLCPEICPEILKFSCSEKKSFLCPGMEIVLQLVEIRMIKWIYGVRLRDQLSCVALQQRLAIQDVTTVVQ